MRAVLIAWTAPTLKHFFACDLQRDFGDHSDGETPVPIPNTAVKPVSADGTGLATVWESRSSPRSFSFARKSPRGASTAARIMEPNAPSARRASAVAQLAARLYSHFPCCRVRASVLGDLHHLRAGDHSASRTDRPCHCPARHPYRPA